MWPMTLRSSVLLLVLTAHTASSDGCSSPGRLRGREADLREHGRNARGYFSVLGGTGCGFKIRRLELSDGPELEWWASDSPELSDIRSTGFKVSAERVPAGPRLGEDLVFQLLPGVTWDSVGLLVLWDPAANTAVSSVLVQKLRPGAQQAMEPQPTMLDNCIELGRDADIRLRWTVAADNLTVDFALEATLSENQWISFGPARPEQGVSNREMVGSDVVLLGYHQSTPYVIDGFISSVGECNYDRLGQDPASGVCGDAAFGGSEDIPASSVYSHRHGGVSFFRFRRPVAASDAWDHPLLLDASQTFVWAKGASTDGDTNCSFRGPRLASHGQLRQVDFDALANTDRLSLRHPMFQCRPLPAYATSMAAAAGAASCGGTSRVYDFQAHLGGAVKLEWKLDRPAGVVEVAVTGLRPSGWISIGFGTGMVGAPAVVGWADASGVSVHLGEYHMGSYSASSVLPLAGDASVLATSVPVASRRCDDTETVMFEADLNHTALGGGDSVEVIWAVGSTWKTGALTPANTHSKRSGVHTTINLVTGQVAAIDVDARLVAHAVCMALAWLLLVPVAVGFARFKADVPGAPGTWMLLHRRINAAALALMVIGLATAVVFNGKRGRTTAEHFEDVHCKVGIAAVLVTAVQIFWSYFFRPGKPTAESTPRDATRRRVWEVCHRILAVGGTGAAVAAIFTGYIAIELFGSLKMDRATHGTIVWIGLLVAATVLRTRFGSDCRVATAERSSATHSLESPVGLQSVHFHTSTNDIGGDSSVETSFEPVAGLSFDDDPLPPPLARPHSPVRRSSSSVAPPTLRHPSACNKWFWHTVAAVMAVAGGTIVAISLRAPRAQGSMAGLKAAGVGDACAGFDGQTGTETVRACRSGLMCTRPSASTVCTGSCPSTCQPGQLDASISATAADGVGPRTFCADAVTGPVVTAAPINTAASALSSGGVTGPSSSPEPVPSGPGNVSCAALPLKNVGDGWCDALPSFNNAACDFDGGDCCNTSTPLFDCLDPGSPHFSASSPRGMIPAPRNPRYTIPETRPMTARAVATTYNNFYEISYYKEFAVEARALDWFFVTNPWTIEVSGLVDRPLTIPVTELIEMMHLEERYYRHRCVEAWSIAVPWLGFPLAKLLELVGVKSEAKYVAFTSYNNPAVTPNQKEGGWYPWPYREGLTVDEAMNELAFLTVGLYQHSIGTGNGAPIRLTVPWKYGFKSIKSIVKIELVGARPPTFWSTASREYGWWANVNPAKPHARWSQATERQIVDDAYTRTRVPTQIYNGYEDLVGHMYEHLLMSPAEDLWY